MADHEVLEALAAAGGLGTAFQPIVSLRSRDVVGVEALARLSTSAGQVSPTDFLPLVAAAGRLDDLIEGAFRAFPSVGDAYDDEIYLAINVGANQLRDPLFLDRLLNSAEANHLEPHRIVLELSETELTAGDEASARSIDSIRRLGMRIAVDDMGTGFSNLSTLIAVRPEIVKIDRSIVLGLPHRPWDRVVAALVDVADSIGATVVAEGVETESQLLALEALGVPCVQGYLLGKPTTLPSASSWSWLGGGEWPGRAPRVGLVEDDERLGKLVEEVLISDGFDVVIRETESARFLSRLCRTTVDIAVVDLVLTGREDGLLSVVRPLRLLRPELEVVVFSSLFDPEAQITVEDLGAHWVHKADGPDRLTQVCSTIVARSPRPLRLQPGFSPGDPALDALR